jgi:hypothetical protein
MGQFDKDVFAVVVLCRLDTGAMVIAGSERSAAGSQSQVSLDLARALGVKGDQRTTVWVRPAKWFDIVRYGESSLLRVGLAIVSILAAALAAAAAFVDTKLPLGLAVVIAVVGVALAILKVTAELRELRP